jgi:hypothetical protein
MDSFKIDQEPTITDIKKRIATLNNDIIKYKTAFSAQRLGSPNPNIARTYGNNGAVSCNKYCHGTDGKSWNNELPVAWKGAQCVVAGKNRNIPCAQARSDPNDPGSLQCVCQRNDQFPYEKRDNHMALPEVTPPPLPASGTSRTVNQMRASIHSQIKNIKILIDNVLPKMHDNVFYQNSSVLPLLRKIKELQTTYAALVKEANIPDYYRASNETAHIKAKSGFDHYILYLLFTIFFLISLFFIFKNPEAGNLDMFMLALSGGIIVYYAYQYYDNWRRSQSG